MEFLSTGEKLVSLESVYLLPQDLSVVLPREEISLLQNNGSAPELLSPQEIFGDIVNCYSVCVCVCMCVCLCVCTRVQQTSSGQNQGHC